MTGPTITFPDLDPNSTGTQCAAGSRRDPNGSNALPCEVCGHRACGFGKAGPLPCETCVLTVQIRSIHDADSPDATARELELRVAQLEAQLAALNARVTDADSFPI